MNEYQEMSLSELADIRVSNVDKKITAGEASVFLCNYMNVYGSDYIRASHAFMEATASPAEISRFKVDQGDVLLTKDSETPDDIGIPAVVVDDINNLVCGYHLAIVKPRKHLVDPIYLCKWLGSNWAASYFAQRATGSTRYGLSNSALNGVKVCLPPLGVQQKIASILVKVDATIEKTEALIEKYQQIKAGLMHDLFTRGVLPDGKLRPTREQAPELYRETGIGFLPKEWVVEKLEDLLAPAAYNMRSGPFGSALLKHELVENGIPFLGIDNVHVERFVPDFKRFVSRRKFEQLAKYKVRPGDVVITIMGTVGRCCVIPNNLVEALSSKHLWTMTFDEGKVIPELVCWQLNHAAWAQAWFRRAMQGGIMDAIQSSTLKTLMLPLPGSDEQKLIHGRYSAISERISTAVKQLEKLQLEKNGLMHDLLTGKVAVKVDVPLEQEA